jgi:hypothetical protein
MKRLFLALFLIGSSLVFSQNTDNNEKKIKGLNYDPRPITSVKHNIEELPLDIRNSCKSFFESVIQKKFDNAFNEISKNSYISQKEDQMKLLVNQTKQAFSLYGDMKSFDFVNCEKGTDNYYKVRYLGNHIDFPTRWVFNFYNSPKYGWIVLNIKFDDLPDFLFSAD